MGSFLFDILMFVFAGYLLRKLARGFGSFFPAPRIHVRTAGGRPAASPSAPRQSGETARDPVCGMFVSTELTHQLQRGKETFHFCSQECLEKFEGGAGHAAS